MNQRVSDHDLGALIRAGKVRSVVLLKGNFTKEEIDLAHRAYQLGLEHGKLVRPSCASEETDASG